MSYNTPIRRFGWVSDRPDPRDWPYTPPRGVRLPTSISLLRLCPPIYDQGQLGSCTANAACAAVDVERARNNAPLIQPSRLFNYWLARRLERTGGPDGDTGAMIRDNVKALNQKGAPHEALWPYDISKYLDEAPPAVWGDGANHLATRYMFIAQTMSAMQGRLASGLPFIFGITVFDSFMNAANGDVPMPNISVESVQGGHALLCIGYDDATQRFQFRNSWGTGWGASGYGTIPYAYLLDPNLSDDFWSVDLVRGL